ncbi:MAG TPA: efflux RND transporter permease subunit, partial [Bacillota bacterium]
KFHEKKMEKDQVTAPLMYEYVQGSFSHVPVGEYVNNGHAAPIVLKTDISINDQKDLLQQKITTPTGDEEKLSTYVTLEQTTSPTQINHQNGERYIKVIADIEERDLGSVNRDVQQLMKDFETPEGYELSIRGDLEEQQEMAQDMALVLALAIFLVFVVMAIQFNSLKHPFIIMSIVPVTITGVIIGMFITQKELSVMSAIGIVMLVGIVLNNGILLIDRVKQMRNQGLAVNEALVDAGRNRLRPIFMTTLTTVGGMIPLALATDGASGYQSPLAVVIISGLLFSTLITLLLIPAIYLVFEDLGNGLKRVFIRKKKTPQDKTEGARVSS